MNYRRLVLLVNPIVRISKSSARADLFLVYLLLLSDFLYH